MKQLTLLLLALSLWLNTNAQCSETATQKILLVGDSWAFFMNFDGTINNIAKEWGHSDIEYYTNLTLSENGAETDDFLTQSKVIELTSKLASMPSLEVVHLSIGGNDFLGNWNINFTQQKTDSLANAVIGRLDSIVAIIHEIRPDVHIFWSGYVYTNFGEVIGAIPSFLQSVHPFHGTWEGMGFPTFSQLNSIQNWFQLKIRDHYANDPKFTYIHAPGLMQYVFGQTTNLEVAPGGTYAPYSVPLPEGNINYPSPKTTMRDYGVTKDCFHLSTAGYKAFISYHFQKFYHKFFMDDVYTLANPFKSGSVSNNGSTSNDMKVGKASGQQFHAILEFDNNHFEQYITSNAELFLRIEEITGTNILSNNLFSLEVIEGNFGNTANLEASDYSQPGAAENLPCVFGTIESGKWVRFELPSSFYPYIRQSNTQFRINYLGAADAMIRFTNGDEQDFQPVLNVKYGASYAGIKNMDQSAFTLYPNPTNDLLNIDAKVEWSNLIIYTLDGKKVLLQENNYAPINVQFLRDGIYIIEFMNGDANYKTTFVKQ